MQIIISIALTPEQYAQGDHHTQVKATSQCPNCQEAHRLKALGYYFRGITQSVAQVLRIGIRRFRCGQCRISVSYLPQFAQPYRLVNTQSVEAAFQGQNSSAQVQRWMHLILAYWQCFQRHLPVLIARVGNFFGTIALKASAKDFWNDLITGCGSLAKATQTLVNQFHTCLFGQYQCHQRKWVQVK